MAFSEAPVQYSSVTFIFYLGNGNQKRSERSGKREEMDRHSPKIQGGVPGGRFFLTSMFCFIKAAN